MRSFDAGNLDDPDSCYLAFMRLIGFLVWPADEVAANQFVAKMMAFPIDEFIARIREAQRANQRDAESLLREERDRFEQRCLEPFGGFLAMQAGLGEAELEQQIKQFSDYARVASDMATFAIKLQNAKDEKYPKLVINQTRIIQFLQRTEKAESENKLLAERRVTNDGKELKYHHRKWYERKIWKPYKSIVHILVAWHFWEDPHHLSVWR
jgi:hypothetical protein